MFSVIDQSHKEERPMKKIIFTTLTAMVLVLGFAGPTSAAVIKPLMDLPVVDY